MTENIKKLLEKISQDEALQEKAKQMDSKEKLIAFARELGFELTEDDFKEETEQVKSGEIDDDELEAVAGGARCMCAAAGGGKQSKRSHEKRCACIGYGQGDWSNKKMQEMYGPRCTCIIGGDGFTYDGKTFNDTEFQ